MTKPDKVGSGPPARGAAAGGIHLTMSRRSLVALALIALTPWLLVGVAEFRHPQVSWSASGPAASGAAPNSADGHTPTRGRPGPWGDLEYVPITIAPPAEFIQELSPDVQGNPWHFPGASVEQIKACLDQLDLTGDQRSRLAARVAADPKTGGCVITPEPDVVRTLSPEARKWLYWMLARYPVNLDQMNAFRIPRGQYEGRLSRLMLPPPVTNLIRQLTYHGDHFEFFADLPLVLPLVPDPQDRVRLVRTLCEQSTMLIRLHVDEHSDIEALEEFWGRGGRGSEVAPLLESLARIPGGQMVNIVSLMPGFARRRLYTYQRPSMDPAVVNQDCNWTALNFFNDQPDDRFMDKQVVRQTVETDYYPIFGNLLLGDLVVLVTAQGSVIHSAVYIADDIVLTKNGSRYTAPWMFARLDDVKDFYAADQTITVRYARRKGL